MAGEMLLLAAGQGKHNEVLGDERHANRSEQ